MSRKNTHVHTLRNSALTAYSLDLTADATTEASNVQNLDNIGLQLNWTGAADGEIIVEVSNNWDPVKLTGKWSELDFGIPILLVDSATNDNHIINIFQVPFSWIRVRFDEGSPSAGTLTVTMTTKQV